MSAVSGMLQVPLLPVMSSISCFDEASDIFYLVQPPARRLLIIGAVHITQFLAPMAKLAGYDVTIIDPRAILLAERFSN